MKRSIWLLVTIFAFGLLLRVVNLTNYPIGFTPDEAAYGYNAYSLLLTGKDEWGTSFYRLPVTNLKSFGDYKLPLYTFLTVPSIRFFGLNEFATRLPNAIIGSFAVISVFFLSLKLSKSYLISLYSAFFMAISPWGIGLSRGAFEANLATFFLPLAIYFQLKNKSLSSALFYALSFYSYHSARFLIIPVILIGYWYLFRSIRSIRVIRNSIVYLLILLIPGVWSMFGSGLSRAADIGIFKPTDNWQALMTDRFTAVKTGFPDILAKFYYAKPVSVITTAVSNFLGYFSPQFLFATGAGETTYGLMANTGLIYLIQLPLILLSIYLLAKKPSAELVFLFLLILLMPLPAALTKGPGFAANRSILMLPFLCIVTAIGLRFINRISIFVILISVLSLSQFLVAYAYQSPQALASGMLYGRRELFTRLAKLESSSSEIRVSRNLSESHIFVAFYNHLNPEVYQKASSNWAELGSSGFTFLDQTDYSLGKYYFSNLSFGGEDPSIILVGRPADFELNYPELFRINSPGGNPLIQVSPLRI